MHCSESGKHIQMLKVQCYGGGMRGSLFRGVRIYTVLLAVVCTAAALVSTIYFTREHLQWTAFLSGVLIASVLAEAARASRSEWLLVRRTAQLVSLRKKFEVEARQRQRAEEKIAGSQSRLQLVDDTLLTMIALIDTDGRCQYHNRAFREWLHLKAEQIANRHVQAVLGSRAYAGIATAVRQSLDGQSVHYEHVQEMPNGAVYRLLVEHVPVLDAAGKVTGFYLLAEDITKRGDLSAAGKYDVNTHVSEEGGIKNTTVPDGTDDPFSPHVGVTADEGRLFIAAIQGGEFRLYCQLISPLPVHSGNTVHYEILLRLQEEEGSMIPPGAFFSMAERYGLMPYLDRWVIQQVLEWAASQQNSSRDNESIFFINIAAATIGDPEFPVFLQSVLAEWSVSGASLCFEISYADLSMRNRSVAEFIRQVRGCGCLVALSGFGKEGDSFDHIRGFQVEFLKIDGATILNMLNNPQDLARVVSIDRVAKKIGVKTVAELVESDEIVAKLSEVGVDYSQGSSISCPRLLTE